MTYSELTRKLRRLGCYPTRFGAGSHELWRNPATRLQTPIPCHSAKDIGTGLLARILRQGWAEGGERPRHDHAGGFSKIQWTPGVPAGFSQDDTRRVPPSGVDAPAIV